MKKVLIFAILTFLPVMSQAVQVLPNTPSKIHIDIPSRFSTSSEQETYQWGCPVQDMVSADSKDEAIQQMGQACMEEVKKQASAKPGVFDVIKVSVVWPDLNVAKQSNGYYLTGTIFLETLVMQGK